MNKIYLFILIVLAVSCKYSKTTETRPLTDQSTQEQKRSNFDDIGTTYCVDLTETSKLDTSARHVSTSILDYKLADHCLCIKYQHSGCARGKAVLSYAHPKEIDGPERPEIRMKLMVKESGDCEALFTDSACFSMKRMKLVASEVLIRLNEENNIVIVKTQN